MKKFIPFLFLIAVCFFPWGLSAQNNPNGWAIVASYTISGKASGLAWDGTYIYYGIYGVNGSNIYKFDPSNGNSTLQCTGTFGDANGLTYKSPNLVTIDQPSSSSQPATALEFTMPLWIAVLAAACVFGELVIAGLYWFYRDNDASAFTLAGVSTCARAFSSSSRSSVNAPSSRW